MAVSRGALWGGRGGASSRSKKNLPWRPRADGVTTHGPSPQSQSAVTGASHCRLGAVLGRNGVVRAAGSAVQGRDRGGPGGGSGAMRGGLHDRLLGRGD